MNRAIAYAEYHRWLESRRWCREEDRPFSVGLEGGEPGLCAAIGADVANYLSTADAASPGGWLFFCEDLIGRVATKTGVDELASAFPEIVTRGYSLCSERRCGFLTDVARLGGAVLYLPTACGSLRDDADLFVAGIQVAGGDEETTEPVRGHLTVDLARIGHDTAVRVIADSALEWALARPAASTHPSNITPWKSSC